MVKKNVVKKRPVKTQTQTQTQIVNVYGIKAKTKGKVKGKGKKKEIIKQPSQLLPPPIINFPPSFNYQQQPPLIPPSPPFQSTARQIGSSIGTALANVPASALLAGLNATPALASASATTATSLLTSAVGSLPSLVSPASNIIGAIPSILQPIGSAIRSSFIMPERQPNIFVPPANIEPPPNRYAAYPEGEIARLLNREQYLPAPIIIEGIGEIRPNIPPAPEPVQEDVFYELEPEPEPVIIPEVNVRDLPEEAQSQIFDLPPAETSVLTQTKEPLSDPFNLEVPTSSGRSLESVEEILPYTASQFEDLRKKTALGRSLEKSQFPLLGLPFIEPISGSPVVEINEPLTTEKTQKKKIVTKPSDVEEKPQLTPKQYLAKQRKEEEKLAKKEAKQQKALPAKLPLGFSPEEEAPSPNLFGFEPAPKKAVGGLERRREPEYEEPLQYGFSN